MKKGFTLLELLAVIVVLAIIALIVTPFVTEAIENARKGSFKSSVYGLKDAAELYCGQELTKNGGVFNGETFTVSNGELVSTTNPNNKLKFKGSSPVGESSVTISDDCQVTLNVTNGTYFASLEPGEVDVTITEEELASREELASEIASLTARINQIESINTEQATAISNNNTDTNVFLKSHPVGSVYTSAENVNPSTTYGGTWTLIEKKLAPRTYRATNDAPSDIFAPSTGISEYTLSAVVSGNTVEFTFIFKAAAALDDVGIDLGTIDYTKLGFSRLFTTRHAIPLGSDGDNGSVLVHFSYNGVLKQVDIIHKTGATSLPAVSTFNVSITAVIPESYKDPTFCNQFVWQRTA